MVVYPYGGAFSPCFACAVNPPRTLPPVHGALPGRRPQLARARRILHSCDPWTPGWAVEFHVTSLQGWFLPPLNIGRVFWGNAEIQQKS